MSRLTCILTTCLALLATSLPGWAQARSLRPTLGVSLHTEGLPVESVDASSLGAKAGLKAGDYLTHWDSRTLPDLEAVLEARDAAAPGSTVTLRAFRGREAVELQLTIPDPKPEGGLVLGVNIGAGLFVASVVPDTPALRAGIKAGDILESLGGRPVADLPTLRALLDQVRWGESRSIGLRRGAKTLALKAEFKAPEGWRTPADPVPEERRAPLLVDRFPRWGSAILDLDEVKKEIDLAVTELEALKDQRLNSVITRLRGQSRRLSTLAEPLGRMKLWGGQLRDDVELFRDFPLGDGLDLRELRKRMDVLMERHGDDLEAIRRILGEEFPGVDIMIQDDIDSPEIEIEFDDATEAEEVEPAPLEKRNAPAKPKGKDAMPEEEPRAPAAPAEPKRKD